MTSLVVGEGFVFFFVGWLALLGVEVLVWVGEWLPSSKTLSWWGLGLDIFEK